jgi:hypothetical protein
MVFRKNAIKITMSDEINITDEELKARVETKCQREPAKRAVRGFDTAS